jgi:alginate O-acetyltransferase complex protein AlgJ
MTVKSLHDARVTQAHLEVGQTTIGRPVAIALTAVFVVVIAAMPFSQAWSDPDVLRFPSAAGGDVGVIGHGAGEGERGSAPSLRTWVMTRNRDLLDRIQRFTDRLDDQSLLARHLRPVVQLLLTRGASTGNERVYIGRGGWLHYAADVQHLVGAGFLDDRQLARRSATGGSLTNAPAPDPRPALLAFNAALARRGIRLVLLPTPVKAAIHPERLGRTTVDAPVRNLSFARFATEMRAAGALLFDPAPLLADLGATGEAAYLARDTHWRPEAVVEVAHGLARFLERETALPTREPTQLARRMVGVSNRGDTAGLLGLPDRWSPYPAERVEVRQVLTADGRPWRPDPSADVLLLGDSFSNIYSLDAMGWGDGAGLAAQLSLALGRPVDSLVRNDAGAFATREALAAELARGRDRLAGKRVLVYQFATRELSQGDWRLVDLEAPPAGPASMVLTPAPGQRLRVQGRVRQRAPAPRPGSVPYRDHIIAIDLAEIDVDGTAAAQNEALVYLSSMEDNVWTDAATLAVGQTITLTLRPWAEVAPDLDGINRAELVEGDVVFAEPWWGTLLEP